MYLGKAHFFFFLNGPATKALTPHPPRLSGSWIKGGKEDEFIKSVREEDQGEGNYMALGKNITWNKARNIIYPVILWLLGIISSGKENSNNGGVEEYKVVYIFSTFRLPGVQCK